MIPDNIRKEWEKEAAINCLQCKNFKTYTTGADEYPQCTTIANCAKHHWENGDKYADYAMDSCIDYGQNNL